MPRNKKYTPQDVNNINFVNLRKKFEAPTKQLEDNMQWLAFSNGQFNYFQPARDTNGSANSQPLKKILCAYKKACEDNRIPIDSIAIIPLLLVVDKRNHFNTLIIKRKEVNKYQLFRVEPHRTDRTGLFGSYNFNVFNDVINTVFNNNQYIQETIYTSQQATLNDTECGAHHINYVEAFSELDPLLHFTKETIEASLRKKTIISREQDWQITSAINSKLQEISVIKAESIQSVFDLRSNELKEFSTDAQLAVSSVIATLKKYNPNQINSSQVGFLKKLKNSRQDTSNWLISQLEIFANDINCDAEKSAMFLFGYYNAINDYDSSLRSKLEEAIVLLLNIEKTIEYKQAKRAEIFGFVQAKSVYELIIDKLKALPVEANKDSALLQRDYRIYTGLLNYLEAQETSFLNKIRCLNNSQELKEVRNWIVKIFNKDQNFIDNVVNKINEYPKIAEAIKLEKILNPKDDKIFKK